MLMEKKNMKLMESLETAPPWLKDGFKERFKIWDEDFQSEDPEADCSVHLTESVLF